jgi:hypothetical protein
VEKRIAKVIDNDSNNGPESTPNGSVQVYIEHLMQDINKDMYPWVYQDCTWTSFIPEIDDYIWVYFHDEVHWRNGFYTNKVSLKGLGTHGETIGSMAGSYPNVKYIQLANGVSIALNSSETEATIVAGDAEIFIDGDGKITITGSNDVVVETTSGNSVIMGSSGIEITDITTNSITTSASGINIATPSPTGAVDITAAGVTLGLGLGGPIACVGTNTVTTLLGPMPILPGVNLTNKA